jgi:hypothetical protein
VIRSLETNDSWGGRYQYQNSISAGKSYLTWTSPLRNYYIFSSINPLDIFTVYKFFFVLRNGGFKVFAIKHLWNVAHLFKPNFCYAIIIGNWCKSAGLQLFSGAVYLDVLFNILLHLRLTGKQRPMYIFPVIFKLLQCKVRFARTENA